MNKIKTKTKAKAKALRQPAKKSAALLRSFLDGSRPWEDFTVEDLMAMATRVRYRDELTRRKVLAFAFSVDVERGSLIDATFGAFLYQAFSDGSHELAAKLIGESSDLLGTGPIGPSSLDVPITGDNLAQLQKDIREAIVRAYDRYEEIFDERMRILRCRSKPHDRDS